MKAKYQKFRRAVDYIVQRTPGVGDVLFRIMVRLKRAVKAVFYTDNFFVDLGFEYVGPIEGHDIPPLAKVIQDAKNLDKPVVIHVTTQKGKGFRSAEDDPGSYHGVPAAPNPAAAKEEFAQTFTQVFARAVLEAGQQDGRVMAISAAMEEGTGLSPFRKAFPTRFFDVGIAEEHAVTFAAGLAARGMRPVAAIYSTFIQRAADQIIHDVCLQNLPVIFSLDRSGLVGEDGETHQGIFDISLFRSAPNLIMLAPAGEEEFALMLQWTLGAAAPAMIRYPKALCPKGDAAFSAPIERGRGTWIRQASRAQETAAGTRVCVAFTGSLYPQACAAADILEGRGIRADLYNLRFLKPIDEDYLVGIMNQYDLMVFAEENRRSGGFGEYACELVIRRACSCRVLVLGIGENFDALGRREELLCRNSLDGERIAEAVVKIYSS